MKSSRLKLLVAIAVFCVLVMMPIIINAANNDMAIVNTEEKNYLIYVNEYLNQNFKFAFSELKDEKIENLNFINSSLDQDEENPKNVAYVTEKTYSANTIYMWIKDSEGKVTQSPREILLSEAVKKDDLAEVEEITKKIAVDTTKKYTYPEEIIDGYKYTVETGKIVITDNKDAKYYYEQTAVASSKDYEELMNLAELIQNNFKDMTIIEKINAENTFFELYNNLISKAKWTPVTNMEILQPKEAKKEDKYVVFLKKVSSNGEEILDAQFMTCDREEKEEKIDEHEETHTRVVEQTSKLPITYDSIILFVILGVIILAIILVIIRKKKLNKDEKH